VVYFCGSKCLAFGCLYLADYASDALRGLEHCRRIHQRLNLAGLRILHSFRQCRTHRLAERQIAGGGERHDALTRLRIDMQLAECGDVIEARIGARIGDHHETLLYKDSAAIGHGSRTRLDTAADL
jgi:hypothetical protein